jgi:hypothetical protein
MNAAVLTIKRSNELEGCLEALIRWRTWRSNDYYGITASRRAGVPSIKETQQKVRQMLEADPELAEQEVIENAIRNARLAILGTVPGKRLDRASAHIQSFKLQGLLIAPLAWRAFADPFPEPEWGRWRPCVDAEDRTNADDFDDLRAQFDIQRLGLLMDVWVLAEGGEICDMIERWTAEFYQPDITCCARHSFARAELLYRYSAAAPEAGRAYIHIEDALRAEGGVSLEEAFKDGQRFGLVLPETLDEPGIDEVPR